MINKDLNTSNLNLPKLLANYLPKLVGEVFETLSKSSFNIYLVGGYLRDLIVGKESCDLDFVVIGSSSLDLAGDLSNKFGGNYFLLDEILGTVRLVLKDGSGKNYTFDISPPQKGDLLKDLTRRDFTINTLALNLKDTSKIIDNFSALSDIKSRKIRAVELNNLLADPIRFLRAFRFAALLSGDIEKDIIEFIKKNIGEFNNTIAVERIANELWKILDTDCSYKYIKQMSEVGLLEKIFPELIPTRKVTPNDYHHLWLYDHSIELIKTFEENFYKIPDWAKEDLLKSLATPFSPTRKAVTKLACLFHDIGKPDTWEIKTVNEKEKHTFYGHDKLGEELVKKISERLKFSKLVTETLSLLVRYHLRPFQLSHGDEPITERALYRFFRELGKETPLLLLLALADHRATLGPKVTKDALRSGEDLILMLFSEYKKFLEGEVEKKKKPKLLDGNEIIKLTGIKPSSRLGEIIRELDEAISVGEVKTKEEAISWVLRFRG